MNKTHKLIIDSWRNKDGSVNSIKEIEAWIKYFNDNTYVSVEECTIKDSDFWFYDDINSEILNIRRSFFSIKGIKKFENEQLVVEQPIIIQPEIGYLGIICQEIKGVLNFLMQAKIEPGNINCVQISPTLQATKSNFTRVHGGKMPAYLPYFEDAAKYEILYDQIQSEQGGVFYKKRNRNMILKIDAEIEVLPNFMWMTLGQIKELMKVPNLVNMDTRTVLAGFCLLFDVCREEGNYMELLQNNQTLYRSLFQADIERELHQIFMYINSYKMMCEVKRVLTPLNELSNWYINDHGVFCTNAAKFSVRFYNIEISGREVQRWTQPLFRSQESSIFALILKVDKSGQLRFLIHAVSEIGTFDYVELGPSVQKNGLEKEESNNVLTVFYKYLNNRDNIICDVFLSEEGGRFYHEQNRNVIMIVPEYELEEKNLPEGYFWVSYATLNCLVQFNNYLNIQLRNLLSLMEV